MCKKVYIFGAGSSVHIGGPLNKDWIERIKSNQENRIHSIAIDFLNNLPGFDNLEALLSLVDLSIIEKHNYLPLSASIDYLENVGKQIIECIVSVADEITGKAENDSLICEFFNKIKLKEDDTVINFNYDLAVDWCLFKTKLWNPYLGVKDNVCGYGFGISSLNGSNEKNALENLPASKIKYFKLHGSINWFLMKKGWSEVDWKRFDPNNIHQTNECYSSQPQNFVITPSFIKMFEDLPLRMLWHDAHESITEATEIYIIGYSFPGADIVARQLLLYVNPSIKKITVIDPLNDDCNETDKREDIRSMLPWRKGVDEFWTKKIDIRKKTLKEYTQK